MANDSTLISLSEILRLIKSLEIYHPESNEEKDLLFFIVRWIRISRLCKDHLQLMNVNYEQKKSCTALLQRFSTQIIPLLESYHAKIKATSYEQKIMTYSTHLRYFQNMVQKYWSHNPYFAYDYLVDELVFVDLWKLDVPSQILQQTRADLVKEQQNLRTDISHSKFPHLNRLVYDTHISIQKTQRSVHRWWNKQKIYVEKGEQKWKEVEDNTHQYSRRLKHDLKEKAEQIRSFASNKIKNARTKITRVVSPTSTGFQDGEQPVDLKTNPLNDIKNANNKNSFTPNLSTESAPSPISAPSESELETFKRILSTHPRISMGEMAQAMNLSNELLFEKLVNWQDQYLFVVEGDTIISTLNSPYLSSLDHEFKEWEHGIQK